MEEWWDVLYQRFLRLARILEGDSEAELFVPNDHVDSYTIVYNILQKDPYLGQQLYDRYKGWLQEYLVGVVLPDLRNKDGEVMLKQLVNRWKNHKVMIRKLFKWFKFFDRYFVKINYLIPVRDVGLMCFREHVYHEIKATARNAMLALIHSEREGERIADWSLLKNVLNFFADIGMHDEGMGLYQNDFEAQMLEDTRNYYSTKVALWISHFSLADYVSKTEECLKQEEERVSHYLHSTTKEKLLEIVRNELLSQYPTQLIQNEHSGCPALLRDHKKDDLSRMYRLFSNISKAVDTIASCLIEQVTTEGRIIAKQAEEEKDSNALVGKIIQLQDRYVEYVEDAFQKNIIIRNGLSRGFGAICGNDVGGSTFAEILAIFCDNLLSQGSHVKKTAGAKLSDGDLENMLEKVVKLVGYISDKDLFGELYRKKLASRILSDENFNLTIEQQVIAKLKEQNGKLYTLKMEFMIKDLVVASEGKSAFDEYLGSGNINLGTELRVKVLTTPFWPTFQSYISQPNLPSDIANCVQVFKAYYSAKNERRKLTWIYSLGTCNIRGNFDNQMEIEMTVSTYQAMILLLFNDHEKLSRAEIKSELNLTDDKRVDKHLHSIAGSKYRILLKQPANTKVVSADDTFEVNPNFSSKLKTIRIPFPPPLEDKVGNKKVLTSLENDRKLGIEACIIRIMKSRKVLDRSRLLIECRDELKSIFKPDVKAIENGIQSLISRDYLELDKENPQNLKYVA